MYTSADEVRLVLTRDLTSTKGNAAGLENATIEENINSACQRINGALSLRYVVPFSDPTPTLIRDISRDIAAYLSDLSYREIRDYSSELNPVYLRYKDALKLLEQIRIGQVNVPGDPAPPPSTGGTGLDVVATFDASGGTIADSFDTDRDPFNLPPLLWGRLENDW
jgi:phage gp36-like protein